MLEIQGSKFRVFCTQKNGSLANIELLLPNPHRNLTKYSSGSLEKVSVLHQ